MRKIILLLFACYCIIESFSQVPPIIYNFHTTTGSGTGAFKDPSEHNIILTQSQNLYTIGSYQKPADNFVISTKNVGKSVGRYSINQQRRWEKHLGADQFMRSLIISPDNDTLDIFALALGELMDTMYSTSNRTTLVHLRLDSNGTKLIHKTIFGNVLRIHSLEKTVSGFAIIIETKDNTALNGTTYSCSKYTNGVQTFLVNFDSRWNITQVEKLSEGNFYYGDEIIRVFPSGPNSHYLVFDCKSTDIFVKFKTDTQTIGSKMNSQVVVYFVKNNAIVSKTLLGNNSYFNFYTGNYSPYHRKMLLNFMSSKPITFKSNKGITFDSHYKTEEVFSATITLDSAGYTDEIVYLTSYNHSDMLGFYKYFTTMIKASSDGDIYIAGTISGDVAFGNNWVLRESYCTANAAAGAFLTRTNLSGQCRWALCAITNSGQTTFDNYYLLPSDNSVIAYTGSYNLIKYGPNFRTGISPPVLNYNKHFYVAEHTLYISGLNSHNEVLEIYNQLGMVVKKITITDIQNEYDLDLPSGVYYSQLGQQVKKFIVVNH